ncbi:glycosyltransferase [Piscibacillus sp. B03]|uniref:glycosyltransferase n=1 Tax=Piscibacillus sp. B03 TaxID=3457430 RepID=UPI003FCD2620
MRLCYVILHYQNIDVTKNCVASLRNIKSKESKIVIVDNASPNNTGSQLKRLYSDQEDIEIIINDVNVGFAKGNNIGYLYAKKSLHADTIIVMNSDVIISQMGFEKKLYEIINGNGVHIIAPDIKTLDNKHQNPFRRQRLKTYNILRTCLFYSIWIFIMKTPFLNKLTFNRLKKVKRKKEFNNTFINDSLVGIIPHGSCLVYTKNFVEKEDIAFLPITFLFHEEDILFEYSGNKGYIVSYNPAIQVNHLEDASINEITSGDISREIFNSKHRLRSLLSLISLRIGLKKIRSNLN